MTMFRMVHYVSISEDGSYHVQNAIGGMLGQHHVHTEKEFEEWATNIAAGDITNLGKTGNCQCGLEPGEMRPGRSR